MRRAARTDGNQTEIVGALRAAGCLVWIANSVFDLMVQGPQGIVLLECKSLGGRLTLAELRFMDAGWPVRVVWGVDQALEAVGLGAVSVEKVESGG